MCERSIGYVVLVENMRVLSAGYPQGTNHQCRNNETRCTYHQPLPVVFDIMDVTLARRKPDLWKFLFRCYVISQLET